MVNALDTESLKSKLSPHEYLLQFDPARLQQLHLNDAQIVDAIRRASEKRLVKWQAWEAVREAIKLDVEYTRHLKAFEIAQEKLHAARARKAELDLDLAKVHWLRRRRARRALEAHVALLAQIHAMFDNTDRSLRARYEALVAEQSLLQLHEHYVAAGEAVRRLERERERRRVLEMTTAIERLVELPDERLTALLAEAKALRDSVRGDLGGRGKRGSNCSMR